MKVKIGFICSFSMQKEMIEKVAQELSHQVEIFIDMGVLEEALPKAKSLTKLGAEVIVSWGVTATLLERDISIPVISIRIGDFDIMKAVRHACSLGKKIAITTGEQLEGLEILEELYKVKIKQIIFKNSNDFRYGIIEAFNEGYEVLIGKSYVTLDLAKEYCKKAVLVTYGLESVRQAFYEAVKIATLRRKEREEYIKLETIFNSLTEGVIVIDHSERITLFNRAAEKILHINAHEGLGQLISHLLPQMKMAEVLRVGKYLEDEFQTIGDVNVVATYIPIIIEQDILGVASTFRKASEIQRIDSKIRKKMVSRGFIARYGIDHFSAYSLAMKRVIQQAKRFSETDSTVLITGETGTGKEILAQSIHRLSPRVGGPFVAINCSVFPESLLESELFGYEEGAFTGAKTGGKAGLFELAHGGTLFLDEIGMMPINLQSKLLRVLQEKEVMRLGGERLIPIDVRIISATNKDLENAVRQGLFREDLYFRLNVLSIRMPGLKERKEDIPDLTSKFISHYSKKYRRQEIPVSSKMLKMLENYCWAGNVRELENIIERLVLLYDRKESIISLLDGMLNHRICCHGQRQVYGPEKVSRIKEKTSVRTIKEREKERIIESLEHCNFNKSKTASILGVSRSTFYRKLKILHLA
jgi:transcriptional regulator with PAS, ATPase and Fis domain